MRDWMCHSSSTLSYQQNNHITIIISPPTFKGAAKYHSLSNGMFGRIAFAHTVSNALFRPMSKPITVHNANSSVYLFSRKEKSIRGRTLVHPCRSSAPARASPCRLHSRASSSPRLSRYGKRKKRKENRKSINKCINPKEKPRRPPRYST